ncbi:hypothetical protein [Stenotrophomonas maltophilia]|uniref:hypothetical protein n=1 Tax=Stenotrophomonas maltophilia TaxID=40324 RepID=UPI000DA39514|nr:hypothetical protein [Stenotrophomonas maltophilia]SQG10256.1 Uncharacterised protein [Stenotrophomonas maltophilia]
MSRYLDSLPHPWTREEIERAIFENFSEARESIEETPGGILWHSLADLQDSRWIFQQSVTGLLDEISLFADRSLDPAFWHEGDFCEADAHARNVKRYIFNTTSSIMALVDHARNFDKSYPVDGYNAQRDKCFSTPGLHNFLQGFRNYNTHWRVAEANWRISKDLGTGAREARFVISTKELKRWSGWCRRANEYIARASDPLDVHRIFSEYRRSVHDFYSWHRGAVLDQYASVYQPYLEHRRLYDGLQKKYYWNMLISRRSESINPFAHLGRYLSKRQVERVLALEHRSAAQIDTIIEMMGMNEFCSPEFRAKVFALFRMGRIEAE